MGVGGSQAPKRRLQCEQAKKYDSVTSVTIILDHVIVQLLLEIFACNQMYGMGHGARGEGGVQ